MNILSNYFYFLKRSPTLKLQPSGFEVLPNIYYSTFVWTVIFSVFFLLVPIICNKFFTKWYGDLESRKRKELPSYVVCLFHHFNMVPRAWYRVFQDYVTANTIIKYAENEAIVAPFCLGYLLSDTIFYAIPEALQGKFEYIIHHLLTIYLVVSTILGHGSITRFIPHLLICDTTNIFFNTAWLLRLTGYRGSFIVTCLELLFAVSFLFTRVINLSLVFYSLYFHPYISTLGLAKYTLPPIAFLQWFWFYKISRTIFIKLLRKERTKSK